MEPWLPAVQFRSWLQNTSVPGMYSQEVSVPSAQLLAANRLCFLSSSYDLHCRHHSIKKGILSFHESAPELIFGDLEYSQNLHLFSILSSHNSIFAFYTSAFPVQISTLSISLQLFLASFFTPFQPFLSHDRPLCGTFINTSQPCWKSCLMIVAVLNCIGRASSGLPLF